MYIKNEAKDIIQNEALNALLKNKTHKGIISMCTGSGKSKVAIDLYNHLYKENKDLKVLLVVPTEKLRDVNWLEEFKQWNLKELYVSLHRCCYASLSKIKNNSYDLVILDEVHRITENNKIFFENNKTDWIVGLTATLPDHKKELLETVNLKELFHLSLDEGVKLKIVAEYVINVIECKLDDKEKYIEAGSIKKKFFVTEKYQYESFNKLYRKILYSGGEFPQWLITKRTRFIKGLKTKTKIAHKLLETLSDDKRILIFCGSINQAEELSNDSYHSETNDKALIAFINEEIKRLSCVNALNEGMNIPNLDIAVIVQVDSEDLNLIQRIGRIVRFRPDHIAQIYILVVMDTQDEKWVANALKSFNTSKINYINYKNIIK